MFKDICRPLAAGVAILLGTGAAQAVELTTNGGFETGTFARWVQFPALGVNTITSVNPASGTFAAELNVQVPGQGDVIKQANLGIGTVTPNGQAIHVEFDARGSLGIGGVAFAEFFSEQSPDGTSKTEILGGGPLALNPDPNVWTRFVFDVTTGTDVSRGVTLQLKAATGGVGSTAVVFYDNASVTVTGVPDADGDNIADAGDNCRLTANNDAGTVPNSLPLVLKSQLDADQDGYGNICDGDLNNTNLTTAQDNTILRNVLNSAYNASANAANSDLNGSGLVTAQDNTILRNRLNTVPGPSGLPCAGTFPCPPVP